jgi:hypothetical protein
MNVMAHPRYRATSAAYAYEHDDCDTSSGEEEPETLWQLTIKRTDSPMLCLPYLGSDSTTLGSVALSAQAWSGETGLLKCKGIALADNLTLRQLHEKYAKHPLTLQYCVTPTE